MVYRSRCKVCWLASTSCLFFWVTLLPIATMSSRADEADDLWDSDNFGLASTTATVVRPVGNRSRSSSRFDTLTLLAGIEGSKQPQDFGVNANLGARTEINWGLPLYQPCGIGLQLGTANVASDNAVRVFELVGEDSHRWQQFITTGVFQRTDWGLSYGLAYDFLYQDGFDTTTLGQWRGRLAFQPTITTEFGFTANLRSFGDDARFNADVVHLRSIDQASFYVRRYFALGIQATAWAGLADEHGESNAVTGPAPATEEAFLFGADLLIPLTNDFAIYGETNLMMPADTGTVDAFMALTWFPAGTSRSARRLRYSPLLPVAASTSFAVDLLP